MLESIHCSRSFKIHVCVGFHHKVIIPKEYKILAKDSLRNVQGSYIFAKNAVDMSIMYFILECLYVRPLNLIIECDTFLSQSYCNNMGS